jgi:hypothetical protein
MIAARLFNSESLDAREPARVVRRGLEKRFGFALFAP